MINMIQIWRFRKKWGYPPNHLNWAPIWILFCHHWMGIHLKISESKRWSKNIRCCVGSTLNRDSFAMKHLIVIQWVQHTKNTQRIHEEYTKNTQRIHRYNPTNITNELIAFLTTRMRPPSEELLGQICNLGALQRLPEESLMTLFAVILSSARGDNDKIWAFQYRVCRWICGSMSFHFMLVKLCPFYGTFMQNGWAMPHLEVISDVMESLPGQPRDHLLQHWFKHQRNSMSKTKGRLQQKTLQTPFLAFLFLSFDRITDSVKLKQLEDWETTDSSKVWDSQLNCPDTAQWSQLLELFELGHGPTLGNRHLSGWWMAVEDVELPPNAFARTDRCVGGKAFGQTGGSYLTTVYLMIYQG